MAVPMPVISASLFARFASRQQSSPAMQAVAALRGQFGGHKVMTLEEGDSLRAEAAAGPKTADAARAKAERKEEKGAARRPSKKRVKKAAAEGRQAAQAGPSSGSGSTTEHEQGQGAAKAGPTSGTGSTNE